MKIKGLRWWIIGLIMIITIINYLDRGTLNYMWVANIEYKLVDNIQPDLKENQAKFNEKENTYLLVSKRGEEISQKAELISFKEEGKVVVNRQGIAYELGIVDKNASSEEASKQAKDQLGIITIFFMIAYGLSQLFSGKLYDKIGTRRGFVVSVLIWGFADALTSLSQGKVSLTGFRMMLGLGEAGPWPGATKSNAEWFPQKERAFAQGLFGAAASIGSILAPIVILSLYMTIGWKMTFVVVGVLGISWLIPWLIINKKEPKDHSWLTKEELDYINQDQNKGEAPAINEPGKTWGQLLSNKKNYSVILGRFFLDPIWWMFVTFLPMYLVEEFNLNIKELAFSAWVPYVGAMVGSIAGGWFSGYLIRKGATINKARKTAMIIGGCIVIPAVLASVMVPNATLAVILMAFVLGGFQFTMTNIQTLPSDLHHGKSVGSLAGLGGAAAVLGTILAISFAGMISSWPLLFGLLSALVPLSLISIFMTIGKIEQIK
jgi:ACS family hexuronate transporter-like MFS transporter